MPSVFPPLTKLTVIRFSKLGLIKNELCSARACFYYIHPVQLRQTKLSQNAVMFYFVFLNAVVKLTKLDLIFLNTELEKSYNFDTELID